MKRRNGTRLLLAGLAALATMSVGDPAGATHFLTGNPTFSNGKADVTRGGGSDTTYLLMNALATAFNETEGCVQIKPAYPHNGATNPYSTCRPHDDQAANTVTTENYDHEVAFNWFPQGSDDGRKQLCAQVNPKPAGMHDVSFARSSSAPAVGFQCNPDPAVSGELTLRFVAFAKDALTWVRFPVAGTPGATVGNLTHAQLQGIFVTCTVNSWDDIDPALGTQAIRVWTAIPGSGSRKSWDSFLGGSTDTCIPAGLKDSNPDNGERVVREHYTAPVVNASAATGDADAENEGYSIFFASVGVHNANPQAKQTSVFGNVDGVAPTEANIASGTFRYSRFMYNVIRQAGLAPLATPQTRNFVGQTGWICKGQSAHSEPVGTDGPGVETSGASLDYGAQVVSVIRSQGFIPLRDDGTNMCSFEDVVSGL